MNKTHISCSFFSIEKLFFNTILALIGLLVVNGCNTSKNSLSAQPQKLEQIELAMNGKAKAYILTDKDITPIQKQAVEDLKEYLTKMSGASFKAGSSLPSGYSGFVIRIGKLTPLLKEEFGINNVPFPRGWVIKSKGNKLLLSGSDDFGLSQAVFMFLEDTFGIHWWTPWEETVPKFSELKFAPVETIGQSAFPFANESGAYVPDYMTRWAFHNGATYWYLGTAAKRDFIGLPYGRPYDCHSLKLLVPMNERKKHPEWVALYNGKRNSANQGLCWSNKALTDHVARKLKSCISRAYKFRKNKQIPNPYFFYIGANDGAKWCECPKCKATLKRTGSYAGVSINFVNEIANRIKEKYPEQIIATLAYQRARQVPINIKPADNVMIVWCAEKYNEADSIYAPSNKSAYDEYTGWDQLSKNLAVFFYGTTFGYGQGLGGAYGTGFPIPDSNHFAELMQLFKKSGVKYVHIDSRPDIYRDMPDMKLWMRTKIMQKPDLDVDKVMTVFTDGYYGSAGKYIREYRKLLQDAAAKKPGNVWFYAELPEFSYLNCDLLVKADQLWNQAQDAVKGQPELLERVKCARIATDRAILALWPDLVRQWLLKNPGCKPDEFPISRDNTLNRYAAVAEKEVKKRSKNQGKKWYARCWKNWQKEIDAFRKNVYIHAEPAVPYPAVCQERLFDYPASGINYVVKSGVTLVDDKESTLGNALRIPQNIEAKEGKLDYDPNLGHVENNVDKSFKKAWSYPLTWGIQPKFESTQKPNKRSISLNEFKKNTPGYHWYKLGQADIKGNAYLWLTESRAVKVFFRQYGLFDVWAHLKLTTDGKNGPILFLDQLAIEAPKSKCHANAH